MESDIDINKIDKNDSFDDQHNEQNCSQNVPSEAVININQLDFYHKDFNERESINEIDKETLDLILQELIGNIEIKDRVFNILNLILKNLLNYPDETKYKELKYENKTIENLINTNGVKEFLSFIGFEEVISENNTRSLLILDVNNDILELAWSMTNVLMNDYCYDKTKENMNKENNSSKEFTNNGENQTKNSITYNSYKNKNTNKVVDLKQILKKTGSIRGGYDTVDEKLNSNNSNNIVTNNESSNQKNSKSNENTNKSNFYNSQNNQRSVKEILKDTANMRMKHTQSLNRNVINTLDTINNKNVNTISSLSDKDFIELANNNNKNKNDMNKKGENTQDSFDTIGKEALRLSNVFRKAHNLPELKWDPEIWKISIVHSKNMADGKVPFGHAGFNKRVNSLPYSFYQANENVFMCSGFDERTIAENAVQGWINSPGHRKNLLSNTNYCAIACYKSGWDTYHLTQIFTRR